MTGRPEAEFWTLTPRAIRRILVAWSKAKQQDVHLAANLAAYQAWRSAVLGRSKRLPRKPDDLVKSSRKRSGTGPDWRAQKSALQVLTAAMGGGPPPDQKGGK